MYDVRALLELVVVANLTALSLSKVSPTSGVLITYINKNGLLSTVYRNRKNYIVQYSNDVVSGERSTHSEYHLGVPPTTHSSS